MLKLIYIAASLILIGFLWFVSTAVQPPVWTIATARELAVVVDASIEKRVAKGPSQRPVITVTQDGGAREIVGGYGWMFPAEAEAIVERWPVSSIQTVRSWNGRLWRGHLWRIEWIFLGLGVAAAVLLGMMLRALFRRG